MKLRWKELLLALFMAMGLWYIVAGSEKMESIVQVRVSYKGVPSNMVILSGLVDKLEVRVRASPGLLRTVSGRDFPFAMDLSGLHLGENVLPVEVSQLPFWGDVEVIEVSPARIQVEVDTMADKIVPVELKIQGETPKGFTLQADVDPAEVRLRGPASRLAGIKTLSIPVDASQETAPGNRTEARGFNLPDGVESTPPKVNVHIGMDHRRKRMRLTRTVQVENQEGFGTFLRPNKVTISVAMPERMAAAAPTDDDIRAWVRVETRAPGAYTLPVHVALPDGAELIEVSPAEIVLTLEQKDSQ